MLNYHDGWLPSYDKQGFEVTHTLDLPEGNRTTDRVLITLSFAEQFVVVTKDSDFVESFLLRREPNKCDLPPLTFFPNLEHHRPFAHCHSSYRFPNPLTPLLELFP